MTNLDSILKSRDITLLTKVRLVKAMVFPVVMYGWMWELDSKESWEPKNWCFWTVVLEKTLENPLDCKEMQPVHPKGNQSWIFTGRSDAKAEAPIIWLPDKKSWFIGKEDLMLGKIEGETGERKSSLEAQYSENKIIFLFRLFQHSENKKIRSYHLVLSLHGKYMEKQWKHDRLYFFGLQNHYRWWLQPWN